VNRFDDVPVAEQSYAFLNLLGQDKEAAPRRKPRAVTATTNVNPLDREHDVDCTSAAVTLTLESAIGCDGRWHVFKKTDSGSNAMIIAAGAELIEGAASVNTTVQGITFMVWSTGATWRSVILAPGTAPGAGTVTSVSETLASDDTETIAGVPITTSGTIARTAVDAGSDKLVGWDESAGKKIYFTLGTGLSTSTTTLNGTAGTVTSVGLIDTNDDTTGVSGTPVTGSGTLSLDAVDAGSDKFVFWDESAGKKVYGTFAGSLAISDTTLQDYQWIAFRICHKDTALATGELEISYPPGFTLLDVKAHVDTVSSSGTPTFDIKEAGTTMLSTLITIDASENSSNTAATPPVISDSTFTAFAKLTLHCTVAGTGTKGAMIYMKVRWT